MHHKKMCPYCGEFITEPNKEHFFPQTIYPNEWDFYACREYNRLKGQHIIYPRGELFKLRPSDLSMKKFEYLWKVSGNVKYLNILPATTMRKVFMERKWISNTSLFSIEERQFYKLDRLKEIYTFYVNNIITNHSSIALAIAIHSSHIYFIHEYNTELLSPFPEVKTLSIKDFTRAHIAGWLMYGSARDGIWQSVQSYTDYFKELLTAPSCVEMLQYGYREEKL